MTETRTGAITLKGTPIDVVGSQLEVGQQAPDFTLQNSSLEDVTLASFAGKTRVIATVPSLDTPVCQEETKSFNERVASLDGVEVLVVSADLPFAQKRWCGAAGAENVQCLSDYKDHTFGSAYGVRIKEVGLLARTVIVLDRDDEMAWKSFRNLPSTHLLAADQLNTYDVLVSDYVVFTSSTLPGQEASS